MTGALAAGGVASECIRLGEGEVSWYEWRKLTRHDYLSQSLSSSCLSEKLELDDIQVKTEEVVEEKVVCEPKKKLPTPFIGKREEQEDW